MKIQVNKPAGTRPLSGGKLCPEDIKGTPVLQCKSVTQNGTMTPNMGYAGLGSATVTAAGTVATEEYDGSVTIK